LLGSLTTLDAFWDRLHPKPEVHRRLAIAMLQEAKAAYELSAASVGPVDLAPNLERRTLEAAALENVKFAPRFALRQLQAMKQPGRTVEIATAIGLIGFLTGDVTTMREGFAELEEILQRKPDVKAWLAKCVENQTRDTSKKKGCRLTCMPWCGVELISTEERDVLLQEARIDNPVIDRLLQVF
ncbi:MAG: hypothetical protein ACI9OJ_003150, partial [Myxococcota bacterium]